METVDCIVIGAGVVGLAVARALALDDREVMVLEAEPIFGSQTSARNSEVVHAGIYYPPDSLKARFCIRGRDLLYAYCRERGIAHKQLGKLIVAVTPAETDRLEGIAENASRSGVGNLERLGPADVRSLEPELACTAALLSPSTGIVDSHSFMLSLLGDLENAGGMAVFNAPVTSGAVQADGLIALDTGGDEPMRIAARSVVNSACLGAQAVARAIAGYDHATVPRLHTARGNYFSLAGKAPFSHLIYPIPVEGGLGHHLTLDLAGRARFGPDVEWTDDLSYDVDPSRAPGFYAGVRAWWPALPDGALLPDYSGIRPKITGPGEAAGDFTVHGSQVHGVDGLVNLFGIESPGLTSSLAIAEHVAALLRTQTRAGA